MRGFFKFLLSFIRPSAWDVPTITAFFTPHILTAVTVMLGYWSSIPIPAMWIFVAAVMTFAAISNALVQFTVWRQKVDVEHKLVFAGAQFAVTDEGDAIAFKISLANRAHFPLNCVIKRFESQLGDRIPKEKDNLPQTRELKPYFALHYQHMPVSFDKKDGEIVGFIEYEIEYRRGNGKPYYIKDRKKATIKITDKGKSIRGSWSDAPLEDITVDAVTP